MNVGITLNGVVRDLIGTVEEIHPNWIDYYENFSGDTIVDISETDLFEIQPDRHIKEYIEVSYDKPHLLKLDEKEDLLNISQVFNFCDKDNYDKFLYEDLSFELFGKADLVSNDAMVNLNLLYSELVKLGHSVTIVSQERDNSKLGTFQFLSRNKFYCNNLKFLYNYSKVWDLYDIIITANPYILKTKPKGKQSIKVLTKYNTGVQSDIEVSDLKELLKLYQKTK